MCNRLPIWCYLPKVTYGGGKMATIKEVAKEAGLSVASVSRYINNKGYVGEEAKLRIEAAIQKLNYRPNEIARSLFQKKTNMIGLIIPDISNPFFPMLARGVEDYLAEHNYQMVLGNTANDLIRENQYYNSFQQHNFAGIITAVEPLHEEERTVPVIHIDRVSEGSQFYVRADHFLGGSLVAQAVIDSQPKKVLIMSGPKNIWNVSQKNQELVSQLQGQEVPYTELAVETFGLENIMTIVKEVFAKIPEHDTVVATNDIHAIYLIKEALSRGIKIPEELQVIGYDGIDFAELLVPTLTTVRQPVYEMGSLAAEMLINQIKGQGNDNKRVCLPVTISPGATMRKKD